jgi:hypothetical protein
MRKLRARSRSLPRGARGAPDGSPLFQDRGGRDRFVGARPPRTRVAPSPLGSPQAPGRPTPCSTAARC